MLSDLFSTPHSCQHCQKLILDISQARSLIASGASDRKHGQRVQDWLDSVLSTSTGSIRLHKGLNDGIVIFDFTLAEAREAAKESCGLCISILGDGRPLRGGKGEDSLLAARVGSNYIFFGVPWLETHGKKEEIGHRIVVRPYWDSSYCNFQLIATEGSAASKYIFTRPINIKPASEESFNLARGWLRTCLETHHMCPKPEGGFTPTRLIEIVQKGGRRYLCLREATSGVVTEVEPYAALTYCWGGEQHVTTNTKTAHRHMVRINMQDLPKTLRDAILVTEKLGIRKIWIDALCIIQDDPYDKAIEISQMPSVYSGACVTIAASRAISVQEGFLQDRHRMASETPDLVFELPYRRDDGASGSVVLIPPIKETVEPLDRRAWSLQERILSPRVLEYGSLRLRWICQQNQRFKVLTDGLNDNAIFSNERSDDLFTTALQLILGKKDLPTAKTAASTDDSLRQWRRLVEAYTHRTLTLPSDRILAISGLASRFGGILCDDYCAGLWRSSLPTDLFWKTDHHPLLEPRPPEYQGPSWSWTTINTPIRFAPHSSDYQVDSLFEILDCKTKPRDQDLSSSYSDIKFGAVDSGALTVKGRIWPAEWLRSNSISRPSQYGALRLPDIMYQDEMSQSILSPDAFEEEFANTGVDALPIYLLIVYVFANGDGKQGLMLRRKDNGQYTRLGIFDLRPGWRNQTAEGRGIGLQRRYQDFLDQFDRLEPQAITII